MTEERCKHELVIRQCDLCRPRAEPDPFLAVAAGVGPWFPARFAGRCLCGEPVERGDDIRMIHSGFYEGRCCEL